jgi:hypothetical protein
MSDDVGWKLMGVMRDRWDNVGRERFQLTAEEREQTKGLYPRSPAVLAGLTPNADIPPWEHTTESLPAELLAKMGSALEDPLCSSPGHARTLQGARRLHDEVVRLRAICAAYERYVAELTDGEPQQRTPTAEHAGQARKGQP